MKYHIDIALGRISSKVTRYIRANGLSKSRFGKLAVNDEHAVSTLSSMRPERLRKIEAFMAKHAKKHPEDASHAGSAGQSEHTKRGCGRKAVKSLSKGTSSEKEKPRKASNKSSTKGEKHE